MAPEGTSSPTEDEKRLAELGYSQDLERGWTRFTNFAISFSIISVLAGCFTTFYVAWNNGGPIAISIGWPVIALIILTVAVSMAELASAYPTAGGPYWWANSLGGPGWSWFTGWFNVLGLIGIVASVDYILSFFLTQLFGLWSLDLGFINFADQVHVVKEIFALFVVILALHALINIFSHRLLALFNSIGVLARGRRRDHHRNPGVRARPSPEREVRLHAEDQQLRLRRRSHRRRHLLVPRPTGWLPVDDVHDHRL